MAKLKALVEGGKASAGAPLGPALGPMGVNVGQVVAEINKQTANFIGMKVPIELDIDTKTRKFTVSVGSPPTSALLLKEAGIQSGAKNPKTETVGNITLQQAIKVANSKMEYLNSYKFKSAVKEVLGTCNNMGLTVEGKKGKELIAEINQGNY